VIRVECDPATTEARVIVRCDHCGEQITNGGMGLYTWDEVDAKSPAGAVAKFFHKGTCDPQRRGRPDEECAPWEELARFPTYLSRNIDPVAGDEE